MNGCPAGSASDTIQFSKTGTITLLSTLPTVTGSLTITSPTASPGITISGGGLVQVTQVASSGTLNLKFLTIANGFLTNGSAKGGAIFINSNGTLTVTNCTFSGNQAIGVSGTAHGTQGLGGAIYNNGTLTVTNSTFSGNVTQGDLGILNSGEITDSEGGAIDNESTLTVTNSTFSGNLAKIGGAGSGAIWNGDTMSLTNSTFSGNGPGVIYNQGTMVVTDCTLNGNFGHGCRQTSPPSPSKMEGRPRVSKAPYWQATPTAIAANFPSATPVTTSRMTAPADSLNQAASTTRPPSASTPASRAMADRPRPWRCCGQPGDRRDSGRIVHRSGLAHAESNHHRPAWLCPPRQWRDRLRHRCV